MPEHSHSRTRASKPAQIGRENLSLFGALVSQHDYAGEGARRAMNGIVLTVKNVGSFGARRARRKPRPGALQLTGNSALHETASYEVMGDA